MNKLSYISIISSVFLTRGEGVTSKTRNMGESGYKIYVGNLSYDVQNEDLREHFSKYNVLDGKEGEILQCLRGIFAWPFCERTKLPASCSVFFKPCDRGFSWVFLRFSALDRCEKLYFAISE